MEFIEAQQPAYFRYRGRGALNWIVLIALTVLDFLPVNMNALMNIGHELVEVNASFADDCACLEEEVHQHGLATTDVAVDVKAPERQPGLLALAEWSCHDRRRRRRKGP